MRKSSAAELRERSGRSSGCWKKSCWTWRWQRQFQSGVREQQEQQQPASSGSSAQQQQQLGQQRLEQQQQKDVGPQLQQRLLAAV